MVSVKVPEKSNTPHDPLAQIGCMDLYWKVPLKVFELEAWALALGRYDPPINEERMMNAMVARAPVRVPGPVLVPRCGRSPINYFDMSYLGVFY
ncbi:MAG TPA: hypothetical protein VGR56_01275 [Nitrososphaerales archaeon]|nr:hypothetical protein [Nitrososphaerales archaeon]